MSKNFYSEKSKRIWIKLGEVNGVRFDKENNRIIIIASCEDSDIHNSLVKESLSIDSELHNQAIQLAKYNSKYKHHYYFVDSSNIKEGPNAQYVYSPIGFKMNYSKITELLIGSKLYPENLYALREIIQNSLDALSVLKN